jgi:hypothetical protein
MFSSPSPKTPAALQIADKIVSAFSSETLSSSSFLKESAFN